MKLPLSKIKPNPDNPRLIKDDAFKKLVQSLIDFPEMTEVRELVLNKDHVILGGNMRFRAMQEAGWKEAPVKIVDWSEAKQKEFVIKDNVAGGDWDWDAIANEWGDLPLDDWGLILPVEFNDGDTPEYDQQPDERNLQPYTVFMTNEEISRLVLAVEQGLDVRKVILEALDEVS